MSIKMPKWTRIPMFLLVTAGIAAAVILVWPAAGVGISSGAGPADLDSGVQSIRETEMGPEEILKQLQEEADNSSFRFKINTAPSFPSAREEGDWCIINSPVNTFYMRVVITDSNGRELYRSRELRPGGQEMTGLLMEDLEAGAYPATATAFAIDPETGETVGSAETALVITVGDT